MTHHIMAAISAHGFGHLAQIAPVINACQRLSDQGVAPEFELTFRSTLPRTQIAARVPRPFHLDIGADDFGMVMLDALRVDLLQSLQRYAILHQRWDEHVETLAQHLQTRRLTGVLADAPYLTLAAAKAANIPSVAICSLNWAEILEQCVRRDPEATKAAGVSAAQLTQILQQMREAYSSTRLVMRPQPAIDTPGFKTMLIEPLTAGAPPSKRAELLAWIKQQTNYLTADEDCWIVLTSMGGINLPLHPESWPTTCMGRKLIYLMDRDLVGHSSHAIGFDLNRFDFAVMMASCDVVLTKPGYGMFVETRVNRKPLLYLERDQWPESDCLMQWAHEQMHARKITLQQIATGDFADELAAMLQQPTVDQADFKGSEIAANLITQHLLDS
ncbi:hypothetical protein [Orrella daihaiensis]|uniref:Glycosyl transferase family 28 C-terminal domain-containing protein n=1 Tax=Orrella daihaiensis TaxID=2782176 RepID=A0ABY4AJA9_9BURK|nr:hypothetical protein [Orrella daihaiensis]UOD50368.1 hypothetical protein DHf2319_13240 [Orrella daihaiensis]